MDTIFAVATTRGKSGVAVIRISGPDAFETLARVTGKPIPEPRVATLRWITDPRDGGRLDNALVIVFSAPHSFTGENVVEIQTHGGLAVVSSVMDALATCPGCRVAEAGEFTRRALMNDRVDLAQVEGLADLINAETKAQQQQALRVFDGVLSDRVANWRQKLLHAMALLEATIDFADEEVPVDVSDDVVASLRDVLAEMERELLGAGAAQRLSEGFEVAIVGAPNTGKSTLLNRLAGRDAAIVSDIAGTTRDVVEVRMDLDGLPVTFLDTAGIRQTEDKIESVGVDLARRRAKRADIRVFLAEDEAALRAIGLDVLEGDLVLTPKSDEGGDRGISGLTGAGVDALVRHVGGHLGTLSDGASSLTRERHKRAVELGKAELLTALDMLADETSDQELIAEQLRIGVHHLGVLVGSLDTEDVLGAIFANFCIGK